MKSLKRVAAEWLVTNLKHSDYSRGTLRNKKCFVKSIEKFNDRYGPFDIDEVDHLVMDDLVSYLKGNGRSANNIARTVDICKDSAVYARKRKYLFENQIFDYKTNRGRIKEIIRCEKKELELMINAKPEQLRNVKANDGYIAQAITGMSYMDIKKGDFEIIEQDGVTWLTNHRGKPIRKYGIGNEYWIPISEISYGEVFLEIWNKWDKKIPIHSITFYNKMILANTKKLGIKKHLTSHTARKTFATRMYEDRWSLEEIALMMGITVQVLLAHYIRRSRTRLEEAIKFRLLKATG